MNGLHILNTFQLPCSILLVPPPFLTAIPSVGFLLLLPLTTLHTSNHIPTVKNENPLPGSAKTDTESLRKTETTKISPVSSSN